MIALVTGASKGIGRSAVQHLINSHVHVVAVAQAATKEPFLQQLAQGWDNLTLCDADLSTQEGFHIVTNYMHDKRISHIFHNVGAVDAVDFKHQTVEDFRRVMQLNVEIPLFLSRALEQQMLPNARILLMNSGLSKRYLKGMPSYCISRSAGLMVQKVLETELAPRLVATINPGNVDTDTLRYCVNRLDLGSTFKYEMCWKPDQIGKFVKYIMLETSDNEYSNIWEASDSLHFPYWIKDRHDTPLSAI